MGPRSESELRGLERAEEHEAIHVWFELTYANYLVLPRSVLQSMPDEWQQRFVGALREMEDAFGHLDWPSYRVQVLARKPEMFQPYVDCEECDGTGEVDGGYCPHCGGEEQVEDPEGGRYETPEEVGVRTDPIPHYQGGRTRLTPAPEASA